MENIYGNGFFWWVGVVEDRNDPLFLGRCKVRCVGYHTADKVELPTDSLPWAYPMQPITSAAMSGIGTTPIGPVEGTWVVGFFRDGEDCQEPLIMGTIGGVMARSYYDKLKNTSNYGFQDPTNKYPLPEYINEPDTNRLARNQKVQETIVEKKKQARVTLVDVANEGGTWEEPEIPYGPKYPSNHVTQTESGHVLELDDTPGAERLHIYHTSGTYVEVDGAGTMVRHIVGDDYHIIDCNGFVNIKGKANITVEGSCKIYVKNNCNLQVDGDMTTNVHGDYELNVAGKIDIASGEAFTMYVGEDASVNAKTGIKVKSETVELESSGEMKLKAGSTLNLGGATKTSIGSPITEGNIFQGTFKGLLSVTPPTPVPLASSITVRDLTPVDAKTPEEPDIVPPGFTLTPEQRAAFFAEALEARALDDPLSQEYASLKQSEADVGEVISAPASNPEPQQTTCEVAQKVIEECTKYVGMVETGAAEGAAKNTGGKLGGGELPVGQLGIIDEMVKSTTSYGYHLQQLKATGKGVEWCASAVTYWWKAAGVPTPPKDPAACAGWHKWGQENGLLSDQPSLGAAILYYGDPARPDHANHIGVVVGIYPDAGPNKRVKTIEGNTTGGPGFNRSGCGCFVKYPNIDGTPQARPRKVRYVRLPDSCKESPPSATVTDDCLSAEMTAYIAKLKNKIPEPVRLQIPEVVCKFNINTPQRLAHFLAQCSHESGHFKAVQENLNYSWRSLRAVFGKYFPTDEIAKQFERQPERIASRAYGGRLGNGPEATGEGFKYRGRGYIQLTGKTNYAAFRRFVPEDVVANPDLVATKYPLLSAAWFWSTRNLNSKADGGAEAVAPVTRVVNGGFNGLADRQKEFNKFIALA